MAQGDSERQQLGTWMTTALVVGNIIGAGLFLLPSALAPYGINAIIGWLVTLAGALCLAWVIAQFARGRPGGPYQYTRDAFGAQTAFIVMWSYWISIWTGNAAIALAATGYLSRLAPIINASPAMAATTTIGLLWLFTLINMRGARAAGVTQLVTTVLKLVPLIAVFVLAAWLLGSGIVHRPQLLATPISGGGIASTAALALWSVMGFESATLPVGKVENSERIVPMATIVGTLIASLFSLLALRRRPALVAWQAGGRVACAFRRRSASVSGPDRSGADCRLRSGQRAWSTEWLGALLGRSTADNGARRRFPTLVRGDCTKRYPHPCASPFQRVCLVPYSDELQPFAH